HARTMVSIKNWRTITQPDQLSHHPVQAFYPSRKTFRRGVLARWSSTHTHHGLPAPLTTDLRPITRPGASSPDL
ncbi:hypothetical protein, partial [Actinomyces sp. HMSC065F12]|uniref:hypothetical protein n=1 Tax=Actinomyces sp. HMSC065F12 TaxID=1739479 RepID=UPI001D0C5A84